jgi:hypothetical protein
MKHLMFCLVILLTLCACAAKENPENISGNATAAEASQTGQSPSDLTMPTTTEPATTQPATPAIPAAAVVVAPKENVFSYPGGQFYMYAATAPLDAAVVWSSSNTRVAIVDQNGVVTGVTVGKTTITAASPDGKAADRAVMEILDLTEEKVVHLTGVKYVGSLDLNAGETKIFSGGFSLLPDVDDSESPNCESYFGKYQFTAHYWTIDNTEVATIDPNTSSVKGVSPGTATVTLHMSDGNITATGTVTVR